MFVLPHKADKLFFGLILQKAESFPGLGTPPHEGTAPASFKGLFHFLLSFVFLSLAE